MQNYLKDGNHLSPSGNNLFMRDIQFGFRHILVGTQPWFQ